MMAPVGFGIRFSRLSTFRASSNGQALLTWAWARSSELTSIFGLAFGVGLAAMRAVPPWRVACLLSGGVGGVQFGRQVSQFSKRRQYFHARWEGLARLGAIAYGRAPLAPGKRSRDGKRHDRAVEPSRRAHLCDGHHVGRGPN